MNLYTAKSYCKPYIGFKYALTEPIKRRKLTLRRLKYPQTHKKAAANLYRDYLCNTQYTHFTSSGDPCRQTVHTT